MLFKSLGDRFRIQVAALVLVALAYPEHGSALAYTKAMNEGIAIVTGHYYRADSSFDPDGFSTDTDAFGSNGKFSKVALSLWLEHGLTDDLNLIMLGDYQNLLFENDFGTSHGSGLGDPEIGLKYRIHAGQEFGDTTYSVRGFYKADNGDPGHSTLTTGNHQEDLELMLQMARQSMVLGIPIDVGFDIGYRFRNRGPSDEIRAKYSLLHYRNGWMGILDIAGIFGVGNNDPRLAVSNPQLAPDFDRMTLQFSLVRKVSKRFWLQGALAYDIAGRNTGRGEEVKLGVWYSYGN